MGRAGHVPAGLYQHRPWISPVIFLQPEQVEIAQGQSRIQGQKVYLPASGSTPGVALQHGVLCWPVQGLPGNQCNAQAVRRQHLALGKVSLNRQANSRRLGDWLSPRGYKEKPDRDTLSGRKGKAQGYESSLSGFYGGITTL